MISMPKNLDRQAKPDKPSGPDAEPHDVVVDGTLSPEQKSAALDTLEQDARQLADAATEGMTGGEANKLHDVLGAKDRLGLSVLADAYTAVLRDLRSRQERQSLSAARQLDEAIFVVAGVAATVAQDAARPAP
jgi:hypothetical protein